MLLRFLDNRLDAKLTEFKYFPHGFLNYDLPTVITEASEVYPYIIDEMEKVISSRD